MSIDLWSLALRRPVQPLVVQNLRNFIDLAYLIAWEPIRFNQNSRILFLRITALSLHTLGSWNRRFAVCSLFRARPIYPLRLTALIKIRLRDFSLVAYRKLIVLIVLFLHHTPWMMLWCRSFLLRTLASILFGAQKTDAGSLRESRFVTLTSSAQISSVRLTIGAGRFSSSEFVFFLSGNSTLTVSSFAGGNGRNASPIVENWALTDNFGGYLRFVNTLGSWSASTVEQIDLIWNHAIIVTSLAHRLARILILKADLFVGRIGHHWSLVVLHGARVPVWWYRVVVSWVNEIVWMNVGLTHLLLVLITCFEVLLFCKFALLL